MIKLIASLRKANARCTFLCRARMICLPWICLFCEEPQNICSQSGLYQAQQSRYYCTTLNATFSQRRHSCYWFTPAVENNESNIPRAGEVQEKCLYCKSSMLSVQGELSAVGWKQVIYWRYDELSLFIWATFSTSKNVTAQQCEFVVGLKQN